MDILNQQLKNTNKNELNVDLAAFEGPLDLLLHLIHELKVDIFDIPIVTVTEQYLTYIHSMENLEVNLASEYLVMAATLVEIKTKMMLPKPPKIELEEEDPRQELVDQLIAYQQYREVSHLLADKQLERALSYPKEPANLAIYQDKIPLQGQKITTDDLYKALEKMVHRLKEQQPYQTKVIGDRYSIEDAISLIKDNFVNRNRYLLSFYDILEGQILTREVIVTFFLAILELVKAGKITFQQTDTLGDIELVWQGGTDEFSSSN